MAKSPKKSPTRTRITRNSLERVLRPRKPTKALVELMHSTSPWDNPPISMTLTSAHEDVQAGAGVSVGPGECRFCHLPVKAWDTACNPPLLPQHGSCATANLAQAENDRLVQQPGTKPSNPKDALGILKVPASTLSAPVTAEVGVAMFEGALKYGRHNYRAIGVRASVYYDAVVARHMALWWEGEDEDVDTCELAPEGEDTGLVNGKGQFVIPGTGLSHITKAIAGLYVIRDAMIQGKFIDDRPPRTAQGWQNELNKKVKALIKQYPNAVAPYIEGDERMK